MLFLHISIFKNKYISKSEKKFVAKTKIKPLKIYIKIIKTVIPY